MDFGSGIVESARIVHFAEVDESRRKTLLALIELATENSPSACWDDRRAAGTPAPRNDRRTSCASWAWTSG